MKVLSLYSLKVPCKTNITIQDNTLSKNNTTYYINPKTILRTEPDGVVIIPPTFYSNFLKGDEDVSLLLQQGTFSSKNIPESMLTQLETNHIITKNPFIDQGIITVNHTDIANLPIIAQLEITSRCQCDCIICYHKEDLENHSPSFDEIIQRINILKNLGIGLIEITGGEPFLRKDLYKILKHIVTSGLNFYIVSNGEYLKDINKDLLDILRNHSFGIAVSLDGNHQVHDITRRRAGLYDKIIQGLEHMKKENIPVRLITTINDNNISCVEDILHVAEKYNTKIQFRPTVITGAAKINKLTLNNPIKQLAQYLKHPLVINGFIADTNKRSQPEAVYYGCGIRTRISINSRGILFPCIMDRSRMKKPLEKYSQKEMTNDLWTAPLSLHSMSKTMQGY